MYSTLHYNNTIYQFESFDKQGVWRSTMLNRPRENPDTCTVVGMKMIMTGQNLHITYVAKPWLTVLDNLFMHC